MSLSRTVGSLAHKTGDLFNLGSCLSELSQFTPSTDILPAVLANSQNAGSSEAFGAKLLRPFIFSCGTL